MDPKGHAHSDKPSEKQATPSHAPVQTQPQKPPVPTPPDMAVSGGTATTKQTSFKIGEHVNHPAAKDGSFPAGTGVVSIINGPDTYTVKCDNTGADLKQTFSAAELTHK